MKILYGALLVLFISCHSTENTEITNRISVNAEKEKEAILKTIDDETTAFYKRDYDTWKDFFIQSDYAFQAWNNGDGTFDASVGWPAINGRIGTYIKNNPVESGGSSHPKVLRKNIIARFFSDSVAYLVWDQYNSDQAMQQYTFSKEQRIMEKQNGIWKIANVTALWNYKKSIPSDSIQ